MQIQQQGKGFVCGGPTAWKVKQKGDLCVAFHWLNGEPAMVIYPLHRSMRINKVVPYALPLESCHELVKPGTGGNAVDTAVLLRKANLAAHCMGSTDDYALIKKIADVILDSVADLVRMPPEPPWHAQRVNQNPEGTIALMQNGQKLAEAEV